MRKQCSRCPWKVSTNPLDIPGGYDVEKHRALENTIAEPGSLDFTGRRIMACHEYAVGAELPCVGWLNHQLGVGNNIWLRLLARQGVVDTEYELDGPQHETFEDTLPKRG